MCNIWKASDIYPILALPHIPYMPLHLMDFDVIIHSLCAWMQRNVRVIHLELILMVKVECDQYAILLYSLVVPFTFPEERHIWWHQLEALRDLPDLIIWTILWCHYPTIWSLWMEQIWRGNTSVSFSRLLALGTIVFGFNATYGYCIWIII